MHFLAAATTGLAAIGYFAALANGSPIKVDSRDVATVSSSVVVQDSRKARSASLHHRREEVGYCCMGGCTFCDPYHGCYVDRKCYWPDHSQYDHCCLYSDDMIWMASTRGPAQVVMDDKDSFANAEKPAEPRAEVPAPVTQTPDSQATQPPRIGYCCQGGCHWCSQGHRCPIDDGCFYPEKPQYSYCCLYNGNMVWIPGDSEDDATVPAGLPQNN